MDFIVSVYSMLLGQPGNLFLAKEELKTHTCTRTHPKPFECDICRKGFSTKSNMQRHRNIHTKEKVFQCNHCSKVNISTRLSTSGPYVDGPVRPHQNSRDGTLNYVAFRGAFNRVQ